ncbi:sugar transferase [Mycolicibacterium iranicum]|uniref:sugar transferase n=1 Tax=Mycolicibacterium iranicum TaxID=912594 RepID=UPI0009EE790B|nr:sugar transferase [Mycolicibacterium iranicum]
MHTDVQNTTQLPPSSAPPPSDPGSGPPSAPATQLRHGVPDSSQRIETLRSNTGYCLLTVILDVVAAACSVALALWWTPGQVADRGIAAWTWSFVPILLLLLATRSMYKQRLNHRFLDDVEPIVTSVAIASLATLTVLTQEIDRLDVGTVVPTYVRPSDVIIRLWVCATIVVLVVRLIRFSAVKSLRRRSRLGTSVLIIGSGPLVAHLVTRMRQTPEHGLRPVGVLDDAAPAAAELGDVPYLGRTAQLAMAARTTGATELLIAPSAINDDELARIALRAQVLGMHVRVVPRLADAVGGSAYIEHLGGVPLMVLTRTNPKGWQFAIKHGLDRVQAALALALLSPLFLALAIAIKLNSRGPVFFVQDRVGRDGKVFSCLKFRTMYVAADSTGAFAPSEGVAPGGVEGPDRRTWIGRKMRKFSVDELPQLINVLRGEMSIVGPRPERPGFVDLFELQVRRYGQRHRVKAGMTGWAQVNGLRGQTSIGDRADFDNYYIENWSLILDLKIMTLTMLAVLRNTQE